MVKAAANAAASGINFNEDGLNIRNSFEEPAKGVTRMGLQSMTPVSNGHHWKALGRCIQRLSGN